MFQTEHPAHICHLFTNANEQKSVALSFLKEGLERGEATLFVVGRQPVDDWYVELQAYGIDVRRERERNALNVITSAAYRSPEDFNSIVKARELLEFIEDRLEQFEGVRIIGDVAWEWDPPLPDDLVCHWEATADLALSGLNVRTICQYGLNSDSPPILSAGLRTHQQVLVGERMYDNPFFEAPQILEREPELNRSMVDRDQLNGMLRLLQTASGLHD